MPHVIILYVQRREGLVQPYLNMPRVLIVWKVQTVFVCYTYSTLGCCGCRYQESLFIVFPMNGCVSGFLHQCFYCDREIDLSIAENYIIIFEGIIGKTYYSDLAIDDIGVYDKACNNTGILHCL